MLLPTLLGLLLSGALVVLTGIVLARSGAAIAARTRSLPTRVTHRSRQRPTAPFAMLVTGLPRREGSPGTS